MKKKAFDPSEYPQYKKYYALKDKGLQHSCVSQPTPQIVLDDISSKRYYYNHSRDSWGCSGDRVSMSQYPITP